MNPTTNETEEIAPSSTELQPDVVVERPKNKMLEIFADPIAIGQALAGMERSAQLLVAIEKLNSRMGKVIFFVGVDAVVTILLLISLFFAASN